ncbi:MAG TPA: hypothetical protein PKJ68_05510 [Candidatus Woesebacteria bacterium]|nr:hypothetical protein [Candidatus Woesebacteria bacterium]
MLERVPLLLTSYIRPAAYFVMAFVVASLIDILYVQQQGASLLFDTLCR